MARTKNQGNGKLDEAMAALVRAQTNLVEAQASLVQNQVALAARNAEIDARLTDRLTEMERANSERFARIETILMEHSHILRALPEAIREKIGFKMPERPTEGQ